MKTVLFKAYLFVSCFFWGLPAVNFLINSAALAENQRYAVIAAFLAGVHITGFVILKER